MKSCIQPSQSVKISGMCDERFSAIEEVFQNNFVHGNEVGAAVAITIDGVPVVDLWGGAIDADGHLPWHEDTIVCVQSVSKEITALALHMAIDRGLLNIDDLVSKHWPEYAQEGKEKTTVRSLLDHRAGVPIVDGAYPGIAYDWTAVTQALAKTKPLWAPGSTPCYHSANYGFLIGEILRRTTGVSVGEFVRDEIARPLGVDCYIGLKPDEERNVATFLDKESHPSQKWIDEGDNIFAKSWKIFSDDEDFNSPQWRQSQLPSVNCHTNARALARICGMMSLGGQIDGVRLLSAETLMRAGEVQWTGLDVQNRMLSLSLGFLMPTSNQIATSPHALGMAGAGGATAFADSENRIGFGYTMNSMDPSLLKPRSKGLVEALRKIVL